jgi:hypothetical protein
MNLVIFKADDPPQVVSGRTLPRGRTIAEWRKILGGDEGQVKDTFRGLPHHVSLKPWANLDSDTTYLRVDFSFIPQQPIAPEHQHLFPPAPPGLFNKE